MLRKFVMLALLGIAGTAQAQDGATHLVCLGAGSANKPNVTTVYGGTSNGGSGWGQAIGTRDRPFDDQVNVDLDWDNTDNSRLRMPRAMLPPIHGGDGGWFKLKNLKRTEGEITASVAVNVLNSPKLRIDRRTGAIILSGKSGDYSGSCEPYDPTKAVNKF